MKKTSKRVWIISLAAAIVALLLFLPVVAQDSKYSNTPETEPEHHMISQCEKASLAKAGKSLMRFLNGTGALDKELARELLLEAPSENNGYYPHTPSPSCTDPITCTVCGDYLAPAPGHSPGPAATCANDQVCTRCGNVLAKRIGHTFTASADGLTRTCSVCGSVINLTAATKTQSLVDESVASGHYHNTVTAYYKNAVLVCGDYGLEYFTMSSKGIAGYADIVNGFAKKYPKVNVTSLLIPKSCTFNSPSSYSGTQANHKAGIQATYDQMEGSVKKADCMGEMAAHKGEYMFYRTDHHWTSLGAYYASVAYCKANGITPRELASYKTVTNTGFVGTLYSYAGKDASLKANPDYTVAHFPKAEYQLTYKTNGNTGTGTALNTGVNSYAGMFICGDQAFVDIKTNVGNGKKLIVFKESYGNAFVPYMIDYYEEIIVCDIRKSSESVASIIKNYGITDALIINNVQGAGSLQTYLKSKVMS